MKTATLHFLSSFLLLAASPACTGSAPAAPPRPAEQEGGGHAEAEEASDLDRPVEELVAMTCEHGKKTYRCDECRDETGFARAPASLVEGGLVTTVAAERRRVAAPVALTGEIAFDDRRIAHVSSQVEGIIEKVDVALGDRVEAGAPLVEIESVEVGEAQSGALEARGLLDLARGSFERISALRRENISSEKEFLEAKSELRAAEIRAKGALAKVRRLGKGGGAGRLVLIAPIAGSVLRMHAVPGEVARTEESLVTVGDNASLWAWADLYESDIAAVQAGQAAAPLAAAVAVKAYPGAVFPGTVSLVSPEMDESSRTVKVRIDLPNPDGRLLAGMFAAVDLFLPGADEALAVPSGAVLEDAGRSFVFVHYADDHYVRRPVSIGRAWAGWTEIREGLAAGQTVVADGAFLLKSDVLRSKMGAGCAD
jgi:cobalt-zinc-cadmium efflux system membrane fusion protein